MILIAEVQHVQHKHEHTSMEYLLSGASHHRDPCVALFETCILVVLLKVTFPDHQNVHKKFHEGLYSIHLGPCPFFLMVATPLTVVAFFVVFDGRPFFYARASSASEL